MINNMTLQNISLKNSTSNGQIGGGLLYESGNEYLQILQSQDNSNIIFDFNSTKLSSIYQPLININNKLDSSLISGLINGSTTMLSFFVYEFKYRSRYVIKYLSTTKNKTK